MLLLGLLSDGEAAEVVDVRGVGGAPGGGRVEDLGLRAGKQVEMLSNRGHAVLVKVDEARIALDRGVAMRIAVRRGGR